MEGPKHMKPIENTKSKNAQRLAAAAATIALAAATMAQPIAAAALTAGLGGAQAIAQETQSADRSATVKKSQAAELLKSLADAPDGKVWKWVADSAATTKQVTFYKTSDGKSFEQEADAQAYCADAKVTYEKGTRQVAVWETSDGQEFDSEADARAHAQTTVPKVTETKKTVDVWKTSDGQEFDSEQAASDHAAKASVTVSKGAKQVPYYTTSDGLGFEDKAAADAHAAEHQVSVSKEIRYTDVYTTTDGHEYLTEQDAQAHCKEVSTTYAAETRHKTVWDTSDGKSFDNEADAQAHAKSTVPSVTESVTTVPVWVVGGKSFDNEGAANSYADSCKPSFSKEVRAIHHDAVTETRYTIKFESCWGTPYFRDGFSTRDEAEDWWGEAGKQAEKDGYTGRIPGAQPYSEPHTVVVTPAYDEKIPYFATTDGKTFDSESDAAAYCASKRPGVTAASKQLVSYKTTDGKEFDSKADADAYAAGCALGVSSRDVPYIVYKTSDGKEFAQEADAQSYAAAHTVTYTRDRRVANVWKTSDGQEFAQEADASAWASDKSMKVAESSRQVDVWKTSDGQEFDQEADADQYAAKHQVGVSKGTKDAPDFVVTCPETPKRLGRAADGAAHFGTREEAESYAQGFALKVDRGTKLTDVWKTTDGNVFGSEDEAKAYCARAKVTYAAAGRTEAVEETGHYELADKADGKTDKKADSCENGNVKGAKAAAAPQQAKNAPKQGKESLPKTGDAATWPLVAANASLGAGAVLAALRARRGNRR